MPCPARTGSSSCRPPPPVLAPEGERDAAGESEGGRGASDLREAHDKRRVAAGPRIVGEAKEEQMRRGGGNRALARFGDSETQRQRLRLDAEEIARDGAGRGEDGEAGRMRELPDRRVEAIAEADRIREPGDRRLAAREEMPACGGAEARFVFRLRPR